MPKAKEKKKVDLPYKLLLQKREGKTLERTHKARIKKPRGLMEGPTLIGGRSWRYRPEITQPRRGFHGADLGRRCPGRISPRRKTGLGRKGGVRGRKSFASSLLRGAWKGGAGESPGPGEERMFFGRI